jgi:hypothetical protein
MTECVQRVALVLALPIVLAAWVVTGQTNSKQPPAQPAREQPSSAAEPALTVRVHVLLTRHNGEKKVASQPHVLLTVADGKTKYLRTGVEVPVAGDVVLKDGVTYKSIGTDIYCIVSPQADGRLLTDVDVNASWIYPEGDKGAARPTFRNYRLDGSAFFRDGQTIELASATDSVTGEVVKAEVTVTIVK